MVDEADFRLMLNSRNKKTSAKFPYIIIKQLSTRKNRIPLPNIKSSNKLSLPSDRNCLTTSTFEISEKPTTSNEQDDTAGEGIDENCVDQEPQAMDVDPEDLPKDQPSEITNANLDGKPTVNSENITTVEANP